MTKPTVQLSGENSNVYNLLSKCTSALKRNKQYKEADELRDKVFTSESYDAALRLMMEYVDVQ